jgi:hypothetical protein
MIGVVTCGWTSIYQVCPVVLELKRARKATSVEKNSSGRQLARVSAIKYRETIWSNLYPGNRHTVDCMQPAVLAAENTLDLAAHQRKRTVFRIDGGAGSDAHLRWLLSRNHGQRDVKQTG